MKYIQIAYLLILFQQQPFFAQTKTGKPLNILRKENIVKGKPWDDVSIIVPSGDNFGRDPYITVVPNPDNTVTIAWLDFETHYIHISLLNQQDSIIGELQTKYFSKFYTDLEGFTKIPDDGSYIVGYTKKNQKKDGTEFWICRLDVKGDTIWTRKIFGGQSIKNNGCKCCPGSGGTVRIVYNQKSKMIGYFLGHSQKWSDNIHQGSYIGFISPNGEVCDYGNNWYISHDMDQRMIASDSVFYMLSLGDGYPRAIVFSAWTHHKKYIFSEILKIPGEIGDNYTGIRIGSMIQLSDGNFGIVYTNRNNRKRHDICFMKVNKKGSVLLTKWFTTNTEINADFPKIASRGKNRTLLAWKSDYATAVFYEIDNSGNILNKTKIVKDYRNEDTDIDFCHTHDMVVCPNGDIVWASGDHRNGKIIVYRIKAK